MQLVNWSGALIGPGSEWFWSMLQFVIVAGTLVGLYRQLRLQSSQTAAHQLGDMEAEWFSERVTRYKLAVFVALREGAKPEDVPFAAAQTVASMWEKIAILTRDGHVDRRLLWNSFGTACGLWWATLKPWAVKVRSEAGDPLILEHFEWLAALMKEMDRRAGTPYSYEPFAGARLVAQIAQSEERLRVGEALRRVIPGVSASAT